MIIWYYNYIVKMNIESIRDKYKDIIDSKNGKNK